MHAVTLRNIFILILYSLSMSSVEGSEVDTSCRESLNQALKEIGNKYKSQATEDGFSDDAWKEMEDYIAQGVNPNIRISLHYKKEYDYDDGSKCIGFIAERPLPVIYHAIMQERTNTVKFLLEMGSDILTPDTTSYENYYPLYALMIKQEADKQKAFPFLEPVDTIVDCFKPYLNYTLETPDRVAIMQLLLEKGASRDLLTTDKDESIGTPLLAAARTFSFKYISLLLQERNGATPGEYATRGLINILHDKFVLKDE